jgi:four helix bundle suffix protein
MATIFNKCGGYRKLYSFNFATIVHLGTIRFVHRFVDWKDDPLGKLAYSDDVLHDYWAYLLREKKKFDPWLEHVDATVVVNALIVLVQRTLSLLGKQLQSQESAFVECGGIRERMTQARVAARDGATPGWPSEVAVPVEPAWQETYSASVRRLCRDGVDTALADLFVAAAWKFVSPETIETEYARSASEAFLFRRLESLDQTRNRFHLNASLPIPFAGDGTMEVDLLCSELRLAIELDGAQHFADVDAYRRDRRKDALLQENGYLVLRFLSADVCERLNDVLDGVLRAVRPQLSRRQA